MITEIDFETIESIWKCELWPGRKDIRPVSSMTYEKDYCMDVYNLEKSKPSYFAFYIQHTIVAVNSGHIVNENEYRSRGLWVNKDYRGKGIAKLLLQKTIQTGKLRNCKFIWSLPRKDSLYAYTSAGFVKTSDWIDEGVEFGPNCYVRLIL